MSPIGVAIFSAFEADPNGCWAWLGQTSHANFGSSVHRCCEAAGLCIHLQPFLERVDSETRMPKGAGALGWLGA